MAPEVVKARYDKRIDIYSAGVTLFLMSVNHPSLLLATICADSILAGRLSNRYPYDETQDTIEDRKNGIDHPRVIQWSRLPIGLSEDGQFTPS